MYFYCAFIVMALCVCFVLFSCSAVFVVGYSQGSVCVFLCICVFVCLCICVCNVRIAISALASCHLPLVSGNSESRGLVQAPTRAKNTPGLHTLFRVAYFGLV